MKQKNIETKVKLLTIKEASRFIDGLSKYRIRELCKSRELPCFKSGRKYLINETELLNFVENAKGGGHLE